MKHPKPTSEANQNNMVGADPKVAPEPTIPITMKELLTIRDAASGLELLHTISKGTDADSISIIKVDWLLKKISQPLWDLAFDDLDGRWQELNPDAKLSDEAEG